MPTRIPEGKPCCYILQCADGSFYTGWTNDLARRLAQHRSGNGGRYTRTHLPVELAYCEPQPDTRAARKREAAIKRMSRAEKEALVAVLRRRKRPPAKRRGRRKTGGKRPAPPPKGGSP